MVLLVKTNFCEQMAVVRKPMAAELRGKKWTKRARYLRVRFARYATNLTNGLMVLCVVISRSTEKRKQ